MIRAFTRHLHAEIASVPDRFYDSFDYTCTGRNLTHPKTLGFIAKILWQLDGVASVGIDVRINEGKGLKLQPDVVACGPDDLPLLLVDYESPNSSDKRIPEKNVWKFLRWSSKQARPPRYLIVTTLPDRRCDDWALRYTHEKGWNRRYRKQVALLRQNPCQFWYDVYRKDLEGEDLRRIHFINIDGKRVTRINL